MANHNPPKNGLDKRPAAINKKGRPKGLAQWSELAREIMAEPAVISDKNNSGAKRLVLIRVPLVKDGRPVLEADGVTPVMVDHYATNAEMVQRQWMSDPKRQRDLKESAYGRDPQPVALTGADGGPVEQTITHIYIPDNGRDDKSKSE